MSKYILGGLLVLCLILAGKILWDKYQLGNLNDALNEQLMTANLEIGKAHTEFGNAQKYIGELEETLQDQIDTNNETLTRYGELEAELEATRDVILGAETVYIEGPAIEVPVELDLIRGMLYQAITNKTLVRLDNIKGFYEDHRLAISCIVLPYQNRDRDIKIGIGYRLSLKLKGQLVETHTRSGAVNYYIDLFEIDNEGNVVDKLKLSKFDMVVDKPNSPEFFWFNPKIDIGGSLGMDTHASFSPTFSVGFSSSGYGLTKNDLIWRFPRIGAEFANDNVGLSLVPVQWNVGQVIPLVSNLWIGPQGTMYLDGKKALGLSLTVGL
jgi:hypothetical protein